MAAVSLFTRARPGLRVRHAGPADARRVLLWLDARPAENVLLSHLVRREGFGRTTDGRIWLLAERDGELCGVCVAAANLVPAAAGEDVAFALAAALGTIRPETQSLVGERAVVTRMWDVLRRRGPAARLVREEQPFYVLDRTGFVAAGGADGSRLRLRAARSEDLDLLVHAAADMLREEILDDPYGRDPVGFRAHVWRMIQEGAIFVGEVGGRVVFKAHANVRTPLAAQISGVYTLPTHRGRGHATAGMHVLAERLLRDYPRLCLYVNLENAPAIRTYEAVGFRRAATFKSIFLDART